MSGAESYWQQIGEQWQTTRRQRLWRRHNDRVVLDLLDRWLDGRRVGRVLKTDMFEEAGHDGLARLMLHHSGSVIGVDLSDATARTALKTHPAMKVVKTDVRPLPFAPGSFDLVISTSTLDHFHSIDELQRALAELARTLRPGGELLLTLDNLDNPAVRVRNALPFDWLRRVGLVPYFVGVTCGRRGLCHLLSRAGLDVVETATVLHCPRAPAIALARCIERLPRLQRALLAGLGAWEALARLPSRYLTGHFVAARARKPGPPYLV